MHGATRRDQGQAAGLGDELLLRSPLLPGLDVSTNLGPSRDGMRGTITLVAAVMTKLYCTRPIWAVLGETLRGCTPQDDSEVCW